MEIKGLIFTIWAKYDGWFLLFYLFATGSFIQFIKKMLYDNLHWVMVTRLCRAQRSRCSRLFVDRHPARFFRRLVFLPPSSAHRPMES